MVDRARSLAAGIVALGLLSALLVGTVDAQAPAARAVQAPAPGTAATEAPSALRPAQPSVAKRLPADATTEHRVEYAGRALTFSATAGSLPINDGKGNPQADIAYTAFVRTGTGPEPRPITFVFNGGPGASSAYLQLGAVGPWRIALLDVDPSSPPALRPNEETWLDFTDLVFIDPVGTGYSRFVATGEEVQRRLYSVDGDAEALAVFIRKWIEKSGRYRSPKFLLGESYGGFRALKVASVLRQKQSIGVSGLLLVSPVLDFGWRGTGAHSPLSWVSRLPSMTAAALELSRPFDREALRAVEAYAAGEYLADLFKGEGDAAAAERISARVAAFTGLDPALVRRHAGRIDLRTFQRELRREEGLVASIYDATVTRYDPEPRAGQSRFRDPVLGALGPPLTAAASHLYREVLKWRPEEPYHLLNGEVSAQWVWGRGRTAPEVVEDLRAALAGDRRLHVLLVHGASDLVTPYFETQLILDQLPAYGDPGRARLAVYGGGHMFYDRDRSRQAFRADAREVIRRAGVGE